MKTRKEDSCTKDALWLFFVLIKAHEKIKPVKTLTKFLVFLSRSISILVLQSLENTFFLPNYLRIIQYVRLPGSFGDHLVQILCLKWVQVQHVGLSSPEFLISLGMEMPQSL